MATALPEGTTLRGSEKSAIITAVQQLTCRVHADETGGAGNQIFHESTEISKVGSATSWWFFGPFAVFRLRLTSRIYRLD